MSGATELMHLAAGEPTEIVMCPRCWHVCLCTFPVTGILATGVRAAGSVTACAGCDSVPDVVRQYRENPANWM